jgi:diaminopimelate decarboxylase
LTAPAPTSPSPWWIGDALGASEQGLEIDGQPIAPLAKAHGTPLYLYGARTVRRRLSELRAALADTGAPFRIHYAMKANRFEPLLDLVRREGDIGIDACSPREIERARASGFLSREISFNATMVSDRDLAAVAKAGSRVIFDTRSALRRWAAIEGASRRVGLRIDPGIQVGWGENPRLAYGKSKFGFESDAVVDAVGYARSLGLEVDELHMHAGWGLPASAEPLLGEAFDRLAALARATPSVRTLNVGGGLGWRQRAEDEPLTPARWSRLLRDHLAKTGCALACEPGTYVAASAGVLVAEVTTIESRRSGRWIGLDVGHNVNVYAAHYQIPMAIIPVARPLDPATQVVHVAGNINEANDVFARDLAMPELREGDRVALFPAGAYGASMASDHCMRGFARELLV